MSTLLQPHWSLAMRAELEAIGCKFDTAIGGIPIGDSDMQVPANRMAEVREIIKRYADRGAEVKL